MDDLISRQAAIDAADRADYIGLAVEDVKAVTDEVVKELKKLPSAERRGRWVDVEPAPHNLFYATCSVCGDRQTIEVANYCPMCGASMDEVEENPNATQYTECKVKLYTETKLRFVLDECIKDAELIEKILQALDEVGE